MLTTPFIFRPKAVVLLIAVAVLVWAQKTPHKKPTTVEKAPASEPWALTFSDEFDGAELDLAKWSPHDPAPVLRREKAGSSLPDTVTVSGGMLHLRGGDPFPAAGASMVTTLGRFAQTFGRFEVRCRVSAASGWQSRFRLMPIPAGPLPAIDVLLSNGDGPAKYLFFHRWGTEQTERSFGDTVIGPDLSADFHNIAVEWSNDQITWLIDGKEKLKSVDGVPDQPMYLMLDLRPARGAPRREPVFFDVDFVRVYQRR